jgi:5-methylcytosine-specific restriction endonuclease McrA
LLANAAAHARSVTANGASSISAAALSAVRGPRPTVAPLSATPYRVELTISAEMKAKLDRVRDLMRHRNPTGDLERILGDSLELLLVKLEKERLGKTTRPRKSKTAADPHPPPRVRTAEPASDDRAKTDSTTTGVPSNLAVANTAASSAPPATTDASDQTARPAAVTDVTRMPEAPGRSATMNSRTPCAPNADAVASNIATRSENARRHISRETRRAVFARDGVQCTYVDAEGHRCPARGFLELDHVHAKALGGSDAPANLRVRCRVHNHQHAEQTFGREYVEERIHLQRRKYDAPRSAVFESADRALRSLGFREPEVRRALATLQAKVDAAAMPIETLLREALRLLT